MQFFIAPLDLHHYDFFLINNGLSLFKKSQEKKYVGSATINLTGDRVDLYCEDKHMQNYCKILGKQAYAYYESHI